MTNENRTVWQTDHVTGVSWFSFDSWTALVMRKTDGWHYLVHDSEGAGGFVGAAIRSRQGFRERAEAQQAAEADLVELGALSAHAMAEITRQRLPQRRVNE